MKLHKCTDNDLALLLYGVELELACAEPDEILPPGSDILTIGELRKEQDELIAELERRKALRNDC